MRFFYAGRLLDNPDYLYNFADFAIWSTVEIALALSASSMGTLRPLLRNFKLLSGTEVHVLSTPHRSNNPYGSARRGGHGACPEANAPSITTGVHGHLPDYFVSHSTMRDIADDQSVKGSGAMNWRDLERASESGISLVNIHTTQSRPI